MKNLFSGILIVLFSIVLFNTGKVYAQKVSPYSLTPQWRFGSNGGLNFTSGNFLTPSITSTVVSAPTNIGIETSTSISDKTGAIAAFTNTLVIFNSASTSIKNLSSDGTCGGSATGGGIAVPDPASPNDSYYMFIANDHTGGACENKGINYYKLKKDGTGKVVVVGTFTQLVPSSFADESITAASDGNGNYYIIAHDKASNTFRVFKIDNLGITAVNGDQVKSGSPNVNGTQSYSKVSPCQNKIAWNGNGTTYVYEFDRTTGSIGNLIKQIGSTGTGSGLEFSPDGNIIYYASLGNSPIGWYNLTTNARGTISGSASWSMQLGPDGKIYTSGAQGSTTVGIIEDPNNPSTTTYSTISINGSLFRGISNIAWLNPEAPVIKNTINSCAVNFDYEFLNYFQSAIGVDATSFKWTFGDGGTSTTEKPSHTYAADGTYDVTLEFKDGTCGHVFTATSKVTVSCGGTTPTCNINAIISQPTTTSITINNTDPVIVDFDGSTSTFDNTSGAPHQFYWMNGSPDTSSTDVFSKTNGINLNDKSSLAFQHGGIFPEGTYDIYLVIRQGTCLDTTKIQLLVTLSTVTPTCNLTLDANIAPVSDFTLSENDPSIITFDGTSSTGFDNSPTADPKSFYWIKADGTAPNTADAFATTETTTLTFQHGTALPEGTYKIYLIVKQGLCSDIDSVTFTVTHSATPICNFDLVPIIKTVDEVLIDENSPVTVPFDGTSSVFNPTNVDPEKYYWIIGGIDTTQAFSKNPTSSLTFAYHGKGGNLPEGGYDIYLVTREGLCLEYTKVHLNVTFFFIPNLVTPNGDGKNDKFFITNTPGRFNVQIFNRWGQQVFKEDGYTDGWDLPNVSDGIYYYEVTDTKLSKTYKGWLNVIKKQ